MQRWVGAKRTSMIGVLAALVASGCGGGGDGGGGGTQPPGPSRTPATITFDGGATTGTVGAALPGAVTVTVRAADNNPVSGVNVTFSVSAGTVSAASAQTDAQGRASAGTWTLGTAAGPQTLTAQAGSVSGQLAVTATAAAAARLDLVRGAPAVARAGVSLSPAPQVRAVDQFGNTVTTGGLQVAATLQAGSGTLTGNSVTTGATGLASFDNLAIGGLVGPRVLAFTAPGLPPITSGVITLDPGLAATISVQNVPATARAGLPIAPALIATVSDGFGNPVSRPATTVTATVSSGGGVVAGGTASTDSTGRATFANLAIEGTVGEKRLRFSADQAAQVTGPIPLFAGPSAALVVAALPTSIGNAEVSATPIQVQVADRFANPVGDSRDVVATIASGGGALSGGTVRTDAAGIATFSQLRIVGLTGPRTLSFTAPGLAPATSAVLQLVAGAVRSLNVLQPPSGAVQVGAPFAQQPALQAADTSGNLIRRPGILVRATLLDASGQLLNEAVTTDDNGVATYTQLTFIPQAQIPAGFRLRFSSGPQAVATTGTITVQGSAPSSVRSVQMGTTPQRLFVLDEGRTLSAPAIARDAGGTPVAIPMVYVSGNASVASVNPAGTITGRSAGSAWVRAFASGSPQFADSVYVTVTRDPSGPLVATTQTVPLVVRQGQTHEFDVILDPRGTPIGAATILIGFPPELTGPGIAWQGGTGTQIGFDTGFNALRISVVSAAGLSGAVVVARVRLTPGNIQPILANREIVITPLEVVGVNLQSLAARATGVSIPLVP